MNNNLYEVLKRRDKKFGDIQTYKSFVKNKILTAEPLALSKREFSRLHTMFMKLDSSVMKLAIIGEDAFLEKHFYVNRRLNYAILNIDVPTSSIHEIMKILFEWNYLMATVEGLLTVEELDFCKRHASLQ